MRAIAIAAGSDHGLALTEVGAVVTWGNAPKPPEDLPTVVAIAAGTFVSLALLADGSVVGWGATEVPAGLREVTSIAAGGGMCFAVKRDGTVVGWGKHHHFEQVEPVLWTSQASPAAVSKGGGFALSVEVNGRVTRQGLGDFTLGELPEPPLAVQSNVESVSAGFAHASALTRQGTVVTWATEDQLATAGLATPSNLRDVSAVAAGGAFSLALGRGGTVVGWGRNEFGQTDVPDGLADVVAVAAGTHFAMALTSGGKVVAWGRKNVDQTTLPPEIADPLFARETKRPLGPITLNKDALPKAFLLAGSPDEDIETSNARLPDDGSLLGTADKMSGLVELQGFQYQARRAVACCYNNYAVRQIAIGGDDDLLAASAALMRADEALSEIPADADGIPRYLEMRLIIPTARAVLRINLAFLFQRQGATERIPALLNDARRMLAEVQADPLGPKDASTSDGKRMDMVLATLHELQAQVVAPTPAERQVNLSSTPKASGGCYIATAVYGSYEAPEVVVLRRFRDQRLNASAVGRVFVRTYYLVSPHLVSLFQERRVARVPARWVLDRIVRSLTGRRL